MTVMPVQLLQSYNWESQLYDLGWDQGHLAKVTGGLYVRNVTYDIIGYVFYIKFLVVKIIAKKYVF